MKNKTENILLAIELIIDLCDHFNLNQNKYYAELVVIKTFSRLYARDSFIVPASTIEAAYELRDQLKLLLAIYPSDKAANKLDGVFELLK